MSFRLFFLICLLGLTVWYVNGRGLSFGLSPPPSGTPLPLAPSQTEVRLPPIQFHEYSLSPVASYSMTGRVLSRKEYSDADSRLVPVDLAMGWGLMADRKILSKISITQGGRFYHWRTSEYPMPKQQIISSSANVHIIPANPAVAGTLGAVKKGQFTTMTGYLVNASKSDGWSWKTSTRREDIGKGACELFYVQSMKIY